MRCYIQCCSVKLNNFLTFYFSTMQTTTRAGFVRIFGVVITLWMLFGEGQALTASPIIAPTNKYINIASYVLNTAAYYNTATTTLSFTYANTFTYAQADTSYHVGVSIAKLNYFFPASRRLSYYVDVVSKSTTACPIKWYTSNANKINLVVLYILIIQPGFLDLSFYYFWTDLGSNFNQGQSYSRTSFGITSQPIATSSVYCSLIGLDIVADATYQVGFSLVVKQISTWDIKITLTSISAKKTLVNSFFALVFLYNNAQLLAETPPAQYIKGSFAGTAANNALLMATDTLNAFRVYNTIIGMKSFWIKGNSFFNYETTTTPSISISASSTNNWLSFSFDYNVFLFWYCPDTTPYLMVSTNICYDLCPIRYASNTSDFQCDKCPTVDCYYCGNNGKCTQCNDTLDFRYLNNATMRCVPLPGYYESGVSAATPCVAANCLTCTSATYCLTCPLGKYLTASNTCVTCMLNCLNCTSATNCVQCAAYYVFSVNACVANCSNVTNCQTCSVSSGIVCATCITGYALASNSCNSVCGDNILIGTEACDDGNTANGDGCSSTCTIQTKFYCDNTATPRVCGSCVSNCDICTNPTSCVTCSVGYTPVSGLCTLDCLVVANCSTCEYNLTSNSTVCLTCQTGYTVSGNTCVSTCGDGIRVPPEGCDDGNLNATDGCSPTCTVQPTFYCTDNYPTNGTSACAHCISNCQVCSDASTCSTCDTGYTYNSTCVIDCSPVIKCITCDYNTTSNSTMCLDCAAGYHLDSGNNSCITQCGDGFRNGAEACDDGNLNNTDGCSSACTLEAYFFCNDVNVTGGVKSTCTACIPSCTSCINTTGCDTCASGYTYSLTNNSCNIDCSNITLCTACNFTTALNCQSCQPGYYVIGNICTPRCGDGILLPIQNCDDGNNITGDGCSASCLLEPAFLCTNFTNATTTLPFTSCAACLAHCADCTGNINDCQLCQTDYIYKNTGGVITCEIDCAIFVDCSACTVSQCTACMPNYAFDSSNTCAPICGDGKVLLGENCDDGNTANGDGCSSNCQVQNNFACQVLNQTSVCSLLTMSVDLVSINKNPSANQVAIQYLVAPSTLPAFSTLDWSTVVYQQSNLSLTFSTMTFDSSTGQLMINASYAQDLNQKLLQLGFNFPLTAPFNLLNATNTSTLLVSDNNLSLQVYDDSTYANSKLLEYIALGTSCVALALFLLGYYSGKLIGLQCITLFQLTFLSLLTFQNLSPSFASLSLLSYSCGYNLKNMQTSQVSLGRRFRTVNLSQPFLSNYNLTVALILLPLLASLVMALINRLRYQSANASLIKYSELLRGEFCFYGLMFSAYSIILSLGIEVSHIGVGMMGLAVGGVLVLVLLTYSVLLHKKPEIFGEFSEKFNKDSVVQSHYYCLLVAERVFTTAGLLMVFFNPQGAIILAMLAIQIVLVLWKQPYKGERAWLRPFLNLLIAALIQLVFLMNPLLAKSLPAYSIYGPFAVVGLLAVSLAYNIYYFVQNLRVPPAEAPEAKQEEDEEKNFIKDEYNKLDSFLKKVMENPKLSMLDKTNNGLELEQPGSPSKLHGEVLNEVRGKLNKVKLNAADLSNLSMSQDISFGEGAEL